MADPELPTSGGGWPLIDGWARATLSPAGPRLWQTLNHNSACLSCAWGTGGQNGGFRDELGEPLQRCLKSSSKESSITSVMVSYTKPTARPRQAS